MNIGSNGLQREANKVFAYRSWSVAVALEAEGDFAAEGADINSGVMGSMEFS